jgi:hypothetical protein
VERIVGCASHPTKWKTLSERQGLAFKSRKNNAWIANLNPEIDASTVLRATLLAYYGVQNPNGATRWGFKEVRHTADAATLLLEAFPKGRIVFLVRQFESVLASNCANRWYGTVGGAQGVKRLWLRNTRSFLEFTDNRALLVRFEDIVSKNQDQLKTLADFLNIPRRKFDDDVLTHVIRGANAEPRLGESERNMLQDPEILATSNMAWAD